MKIFKKENSGMLSIINISFILGLLCIAVMTYVDIANVLFDNVTLSMAKIVDYVTGAGVIILAMVLANTKLNRLFAKELTRPHLFINVVLYFWILIVVTEAFSNLIYLIFNEINQDYLNPEKGIFICVGQIIIVGVMFYFLNKKKNKDFE